MRATSSTRSTKRSPGGGKPPQLRVMIPVAHVNRAVAIGSATMPAPLGVRSVVSLVMRRRRRESSG